ncbi:MAG: peptidase domain-containing ABC transporter [Acidobacteriota bacterium]
MADGTPRFEEASPRPVPSTSWTRLGARRGELPFVRQTSNADCGAACLAMVLAWHGKRVPLEEVRQAAGVDRDGSDARSLVRAARAYGLRGRGVQVEEVDDLGLLERGAILHWKFHHFVVFDRLDGGTLHVVDPALGRRSIARDELERSFTGVALVLEPAPGFEPEDRVHSGFGALLRRARGAATELPRVVALSLLLQVLALAVPLVMGAVVDRVVPQGDRRLLWVLAAGTVVLALYRGACALLRSHLLLQLRTRLDARLTLDFVGHLVSLPYAFFTQRSTGDLITRINSNAMLREILTSSALSAVLDGLLVTLYLVLLLVVSPTLAVVVLGLGLLRLSIFLLTRRRYRELMVEQLQVQASARGEQVQILSGIETLKAAGAEERAVAHWSDLFVDELNVGLEQGRLQAKLDAAHDTLSAISPLVVLLVGAHLVLTGALSLGTMLAMSALAAGFLLPLSTLITTAFDLQRLSGYLERVTEVFDAAPEQDPRTAAAPGRLGGALRVESVSFRYGPMAPRVLHDVSLDITPGELLAIVGRSGSGKSTLASLLFGLYPPSAGRVTYDGRDLWSLDLQQVREQLGIVTQHPFLFGASIRRNIALNDPGAPLARVIDAARKAEIHDDIASLPLAYDTVLADGGASLSGGQRQRLALARALFHRPRILLLDEATSALDSLTERAIHERLRRLRMTRIVVAHRLSTVVHADRIAVLDAGRIVELGDHDELLARGGLYAELVASQGTSRAAGAAAVGEGER